MRFTILINNYNYQNFITEAVESAANQSYPPHEILVVDDGSTDNSREILTQLAKKIPSLRIIEKTNGGQLSAFQTGVQSATGDWCFFLDADDFLEPTHLAEAAAQLAKNPQASAYYCNHQETQGPPVFRSKWSPGLIGPLPNLINVTRISIFMITSTIALKRDLAQSILQFKPDLLEDWRIRADDCLLFGSALAGAIFLYHPVCTVNYRIHGANHFAGSNYEAQKNEHNARLNRLFHHYRQQFQLPQKKIPTLLVQEYSQSPWHKRDNIRKKFLRAIRKSNAPFFQKLLAAAQLFTQSH